MEKEIGYGEEKKIIVQFTSTNEMPAKNALKIVLNTINVTREEEYKEAL